LVVKTQTGEVVWKKAERANRVTCSEQEVFFNGVSRDSVEALDIATGQRHWGGTTPQKSFNGLIYNPEADEIIASESTFPEEFYLVNPRSGQLLRSFQKVTNPPIEEIRGPMYLVDRGQLFLGGTVLDAQTGQIIHKEDLYGTSTPPMITADTMYLSSGYAVVAFDRTTYQIKWIYPSQPPWALVYTISPVAILDGVGYVIYSDATLRAIDLETGQELGYWQPGLLERFFWPVCAPVPFPFCTPTTGVGMTASEDSLFVSFGDGKLYAFGKDE
jgi:outer membrane protein assembly factor BamB